jgi:putative transposase
MKLNHLKVELGRKVLQGEFARAVDVAPRTLRNWSKKRRLEDFRKLGRPAHDERAHRNAFWKVGREYLRQGRCGWRQIAAVIGGGECEQVPIRLIQVHLRRLKACENRHRHRRILAKRERIEVLSRDALWVQDSTQVGRDWSGAKIETQVIKDRGSLVTVGLSTGDPVCARGVLELLESLRQARGLPLVLGSDNGSSFVAEEVERYLRREKVIHLKNLPRTPQHNGSAEVGIGELKRCAKLDKALHITAQAAHGRVVMAAHRLNKNRIRPSKGLKTGAEMDEVLAVGYHQVDRALFYRECCRRIEEARHGKTGRRERRMSERDAIYITMEKFGLVRRHRSGSQATTKAEIFS